MYPEKRREDRLMNICLHVVKVCITRLILVKILFDYFCITLKQHAISVLKFTRHMHRLRVCVCVWWRWWWRGACELHPPGNDHKTTSRNEPKRLMAGACG